MTYVKNAILHKLKKGSKKYPVYKYTSETRRKVVIVRRTAMIRTMFCTFWCMLYYCGPTTKLWKNNFTKIFLKHFFMFLLYLTICYDWLSYVVLPVLYFYHFVVIITSIIRHVKHHYHCIIC